MGTFGLIGKTGSQVELYLFALAAPSSKVIGMERSRFEEERGTVMVSRPSQEKLEVTSPPETLAGSLYFRRNSLDTKPWSSCFRSARTTDRHTNTSMPEVDLKFRLLTGMCLLMNEALREHLRNVFIRRCTCLSSCLACIVMKSPLTLTDSSSGEKCFTSR